VAHLTLQEVIDRVNNNLTYYSTHELKGDRNRGEMRPHHPEFYVPRITRMFSGFLFGPFRVVGNMTTVQKGNTHYSVSS
jgi:hypothetical protein